MFPLTRWHNVRNVWLFIRKTRRQHVRNMCGVLLLLSLVSVELIAFHSTQVSAQSHTSPTVDATCTHVGFSPDGNPFPICPGPYPGGGNCTWWAWEQWHLLGYDLPLNWGNAADWIVDAERSGLPLGTTPRLGAIAIFPRGDGVWAYGPPGHVAFVTAVSSDGTTFDVTYQNYGDPTPLYVGKGYNVSYINQPRFQSDQLRFIYFPQEIDPQLFARLPGVNGGDAGGAVRQANDLFANMLASSGDRVALGLPPVSSDQEFNADFTGEGVSDLLLYNRQQGSLKVLKLQPKADTPDIPPHLPRFFANEIQQESQATQSDPQAVALGDAITPVGKWGASLDVHIGDFSGSGVSEMLLYDRNAGTIQLLSLTPQLTIKKHVTLNGWGPGWEIYVGRFDGQRSGIFLYKRFAELSQTTSDTPTPAVTPKIDPTKPTSDPTATPKPRVTPTPTAMPKPSATPTEKPDATATPKSRVTVTPRATHSAPVAVPETVSFNTNVDVHYPMTGTTSTSGTKDLSGSALEDWEIKGRTANIFVIDFNKDFSIHSQQQYTLWHANWEVYVGRFASSTRDGIFLYDRAVGEGRIMDFDTGMTIADYQEIHNLDGNWVIYSGDFIGSGRAQLLLYDPVAGNGQLLSFAPDLSLKAQKLYNNWGRSNVLYVGHFGMNTLSVMLYDLQKEQSTFVAFDTSMQVMQHMTVKGWGTRWQVLVGAFLDRSLCPSQRKCTNVDDILALDRKTGQIQQFVFSFGRQFQVFDNRSQAFVRDGIAPGHLNSVDTTTFNLVGTVHTSIRNEELY